jgi:UDP-2,3-diacylglucosamine pyrophosphatase LpxH
MQHSQPVYRSVTALDHDSYVMTEQVLDTLILSDVHLGSEVSRAPEATELLENTKFRRLILLGDIFSDLNFRRLTSDHWKFLSRIRKLSNPKRKVEVVWVEGNHDQGLSQMMSHLVGVPVYQRYVWEYEGKRHLAIHGHQFHPFCRKNEFLSRLGERIFYELQKLDGNRKRFSRFIDRANTRWLRMQSIVAEGAFLYARAGRVDRIFCGHTHVAIHENRHGIDYYNSGSWVDTNPTYLTIDKEGVQIREYEGPKYDYDRTPAIEPELPELLAAGDLFDSASVPSFADYESIRC